MGDYICRIAVRISEDTVCKFVIKGDVIRSSNPGYKLLTTPDKRYQEGDAVTLGDPEGKEISAQIIYVSYRAAVSTLQTRKVAGKKRKNLHGFSMRKRTNGSGKLAHRRALRKSTDVPPTSKPDHRPGGGH